MKRAYVFRRTGEASVPYQLIGLAQVVGAHPVVDFIGEPASPATKLVHVGRTLERTE